MLGEISLARGELAQAAAYLQQSLELLEKAGEVYEKARSQLCGVLYVRRGTNRLQHWCSISVSRRSNVWGGARSAACGALKAPLDAES